MNATKKAHPANQGGKWIRQDKRLAIYLRDGMACVYCGESLEEGAELTLDHLAPCSKSTSKANNHATNLVTCCKRCNSSRGNRPVATFIKAVAQYINHGADAAQILRFIRSTSKRKLNLTEARAIIARRNKGK